jgi:hypothetical protein
MKLARRDDALLGRHDVAQDSLDLKPVSGPGYTAPRWATRAELLQIHERCVADGQQALRKAEDSRLLLPWRLLVGGKVVSERLNDVPVPSVYGPSADDKIF